MMLDAFMFGVIATIIVVVLLLPRPPVSPA